MLRYSIYYIVYTIGTSENVKCPLWVLVETAGTLCVVFPVTKMVRCRFLDGASTSWLAASLRLLFYVAHEGQENARAPPSANWRPTWDVHFVLPTQGRTTYQHNDVWRPAWDFSFQLLSALSCAAIYTLTSRLQLETSGRGNKRVPLECAKRMVFSSGKPVANPVANYNYGGFGVFLCLRKRN